MDSHKDSLNITENVLTDPITYRDMTEFIINGVNLEGIHDEDPQNDYIPNNRGMRGPDTALADIAAIGCSQTFGVGVQEEQTWPAVLSRLTNKSYVNLATPGTSPQTIVNSAIAYVRDFGKPKYICANFPSLFRFTLPIKSDQLVYYEPDKKASTTPRTDVHSMNLLPDGGIPRGYAQEWPAYSRKPHKIREILPNEVALYLSMMAINHLIEFCNAAGIVLLFTTWYPETHEFLAEKANRSGNYEITGNRLDMSSYMALDGLDDFFNRDSNLLPCHADHPRTISWDEGTDISQHMGVHQHLHYAELFANRINAPTRD
jgi:hypothetical protein